LLRAVEDAAKFHPQETQLEEYRSKAECLIEQEAQEKVKKTKIQEADDLMEKLLASLNSSE
jgi:flagellin-specific chaperone FliS